MICDILKDVAQFGHVCILLLSIDDFFVGAGGLNESIKERLKIRATKNLPLQATMTNQSKDSGRDALMRV